MLVLCLQAGRKGGLERQWRHQHIHMFYLHACASGSLQDTVCYFGFVRELSFCKGCCNLGGVLYTCYLHLFSHGMG